MPGTRGGKLTIGDYHPAFKEGSRVGGGIQQLVTVPLGPPLLVNSTTYNGVAFIAPCDGCMIKEIHIAGAVAIVGGVNTLAIDNYDKSATAARNALSTTNIDPTGITAKQGLELTLTATEPNRYMDAGDVLNFTLVCGIMTTAGQGYAVTAVVIVPDLI